jgi:hypothetical protein
MSAYLFMKFEKTFLCYSTISGYEERSAKPGRQ